MERAAAEHRATLADHGAAEVAGVAHEGRVAERQLIESTDDRVDVLAAVSGALAPAEPEEEREMFTTQGEIIVGFAVTERKK